MQRDDQELLRRFVEHNDESAFNQLVQAHLGLVLGTACRQLDGDRAGAEDLAQQVFLLLANKAAALRSHPCLAGWLYRTTRLAGLDNRRQTARRQRREQEAALNHLQPDEPVPWQAVAPYLDEALEELGKSDRQLILMRHIERQSGATIAARLGVSEPAARKQLERAMDRLRWILARRGVAVGASALAGLLDTQAQAQFSPALAARIAAQVLSQVRLPPVARTSPWPAVLRWGLAAGFVAGLAGWLVLRQIHASSSSSTVEAVAPSTSIVSPVRAAVAVADTGTTVNDTDNEAFTLSLVDKTSGQEIAEGKVIFWKGPDARTLHSLGALSLTNGQATVRWTNDCARFVADITCDGYAETRAEWVREGNNLPVPRNYELALERTLPIGGVVVDPQDNPLSDAKVELHVSGGEPYLPVPNTHQPFLSHPLGFMRLETQTDATGAWSFTSVAAAVQLEKLFLQISHRQYRPIIGLAGSIAELQNLTFRTVLEPTSIRNVSGRVLDSSGAPLAGAEVTDGVLFSDPGCSISGDQHVRTDAQGSFSFPQPPQWHGPGFLTAKSPGLAPQTLRWKGEPVTFCLSTGWPLRLRVVSTHDESIAGVRVESSSFEHSGGDDNIASTHYQLHGKTDAQGFVEFSDLPDEPLLVHCWSDSPHYQSLVGEVLRPSHQQQRLVLLPALKILGEVVDAITQHPIPTFRVATKDGFGRGEIPKPEAFMLPEIVSGDLQETGRFELELRPGGLPISPNLRGPSDQQHLGSYLKITAPGYAAYTSRFLEAQEGVVRLRVSLKPQTTSRLQLLCPKGQPVAEAEVIAGPSWHKPKSDAWLKTKGDYRLRADANGWVSLPADDSIAWVLAFNPDRTLAGYAPREKLTTHEFHLAPYPSATP